MDNVGCYGAEARLTDCAYYRDTSEDSHSGDVWIDCSSSVNSIESDNNTATDSGDNVTGFIVALVALVSLVLLSNIAFVSYILCSKGLHKKIR